jgi:hypothetical protein
MEGILTQVKTTTGNKLVVKYDSEENRHIFLDVDMSIYESNKRNNNYSPEIGDTVEFTIRNSEFFPYTLARIIPSERTIIEAPPPQKKKVKKLSVSLEIFCSSYSRDRVILCDKFDIVAGNTMLAFYETVKNRHNPIAYYPIAMTAITNIEDLEVEID